MSDMRSSDVAIVGGGIGGSALATALARDGLDVGEGLSITTFANDCGNRSQRRARFFEMMENEPLLLAMMMGAMGGPEVGPPEAFDGRLLAAMRS
jgi:glycine/D-amino acid oxidase-like deaminating enzyme